MRRVACAATLVAALIALGWLCRARAHELSAALALVPVEALVLLGALHLLTLCARSEAWRLALAAIEGRVPPRGAVHAANAGAFLVGSIESHSALPVRMLLLRRLAGDDAPRPAQILAADAPIFLLEVCATALLLSAVTPLAGAVLAVVLL